MILGCEHLDLVTKGDNGVGGGAGPEGGEEFIMKIHLRQLFLVFSPMRPRQGYEHIR